MNVGLAMLPSIGGEVEELVKICGPQGIRKSNPLNRDEMIEKIITVTALNSVASAQEVVALAWKDVEANTQMKRARIRSLLEHWAAVLRTVKELQKTNSERTVRYVIGHQMQARASISPDGRVILDIGANIFVDFSYEEAEQRLMEMIKTGQQCATRLLECYEECKRNIVTSDINISQLHNYSVEMRESLMKTTS